MRTRPFNLILSIGLAFQTASAQDWEGIERDVGGLVQRWGVPGVVVGVVQDDEVLWKAAFGSCKSGDGVAVDSRTLFDIGSVSKSFTTAALMMLVESGEIDLDTPVRQYMPELKFPSDSLDRQVALRDMLSHRTGIAPNNVMFWGNDLSRAEVLRRSRYLPVSAPFGKQFQYNNIMYLAAGEVLGKVTQGTWDDFVRQRIFEPLEMTRTRATRTAVADLDNQAQPHFQFGDGWRPMPFIDLDNAAPGGSIVSCLDDFLNYARMFLAEGTFEDKAILQPGSIEEMWRPHISIPPGGVYAQMAPLSERLSYGMGFFVHEYDGQFVAEHGGQTDGMHSGLYLVPEEGLGVVVFTNGLNIALPSSIFYRILDELQGRPPEPAQKAFWASWQQMSPRMMAQEFKLPRGVQPTSEAQLARLPGTYASGLYGPANLRTVDDHLELELLGRTVTLHHLGAGRFAPDWGADQFMSQAIPTLNIQQGTSPAKDRLNIGGTAFRRVE